MRITLVSYEFTFSPFSGNGILARSLVKSLLLWQTGDLRVTVICCSPQVSTSPDQPLHPPEIPNNDSLCVYDVKLNESRGWKSLDIRSAWNDFVLDSLSDEQARAVLAEAECSDVALVVDWTGAHAWRSIQSRVGKRIPMVYLNFRVYSSGVSVDSTFYDNMERSALLDADIVVALSEADRSALQRLMGTEKGTEIRLLFPPLRGDIQKLATSTNPTEIVKHLPFEAAVVNPDCSFVTCIARLGREKQVARFVRFVEDTPDLWQSRALIPLLAGAESDHDYAESVKGDLRRCQPQSVIIDRFLPAHELAAVLQRTVLNFHPSAYDAYGMTVVEAAAFQVPSVISEHVGSRATVGDACVAVEMCRETEELTDSALKIIRTALDDRKGLRRAGSLAKAKALSWDEVAYGKKLLSCVRSILVTKSLITC